MSTAREFVSDSYNLINASSPTVPLYGSDLSNGIRYLNDLILSYSGTGLMITVAKNIKTTVIQGQEFVTFADPAYLPVADVPEGRLANIQNAFLLLSGVTYPLSITNRNDFMQSYRFDPLKGLPRFAIIFPEIDVTSLRLYPAPSQSYELNVYGKFELPELTSNSDMSVLPAYYRRFLKFALAKELAMYGGRSQAWDEKLDAMLVKAEADMISVSSVNLKINSDRDDLLNGAHRVRAGI